MAYARYAWVANRIKREDMNRLYYLKQETKKPITRLVAEAVKTAQDEYCAHLRHHWIRNMHQWHCSIRIMVKAKE